VAGSAAMSEQESDVARTEEEAHDEPVKARLAVHTVSVPPVEEHTSVSMEAVERVLELTAKARHEIGVRRRGLLVASIFIFFAIVLLILKIRQVERPGG